MSVEAKRGCGYRRMGGLYMVSGKLGAGCGRLPLPLVCCPTCGAGFAPARGWTWIKPTELFKDAPKCVADARFCRTCPASDLSRMGERAGMLWAGEQFYPTPAHFLHEAEHQGVSRRISAVPRGFKVGETWVLIAHRKACPMGDEIFPGVITMFRPERVEIILPEDAKGDDKLQAVLEKRGLSPVYVPESDPDHYDGGGLEKVRDMQWRAAREPEKEG